MVETSASAVPTRRRAASERGPSPDYDGVGSAARRRDPIEDSRWRTALAREGDAVASDQRHHQRDRKGIGMAIGPVAVSAGVHHHIVLADTPEGVVPGPSEARGLEARVYPQ